MLTSAVRRITPFPVSSGESHGTGGWSRREQAGLLLAAAVSGAAWLPFLKEPLSADESGYLLLAQHWSPGASLYGDYWVDRPPLLLWLFSLAGHLGAVGHGPGGITAPTVKLLGAVAAVGVVLLSGLASGLVAPASSWPRRTATVVVAALLCSPVIGMPETDGEILAAPFVLLGLAGLIAAYRRPAGRRAALLAAGGGAAAMCAALVKQNVVDVFVFALVLLAVMHRRDRSAAWRRTGAVVVGSIAVLVAAAAAAALRGTSPAELWDAIVTFRLQATTIIGSSASPATAARFDRLAMAFLGSGAAALLLVVVLLHLREARGRRPSRAVRSGPLLSRQDLTWPALALAAWEACGVVLGGSYWLHYLTGLVPGLALLISLLRPSRRWAMALNACVAYTLAASIAVWGHHLVADRGVSTDAQVTSYLRGHATAGDGVVVAFGHPDIVAGSGLASPYPMLWSLPVRVRDPQLRQLERVMSGPQAPRWVVVAGNSLGTWGVESGAAQHYLTAHYVEQATYGTWHIWRRT